MSPIGLEDVEALYRMLSAEERDDLLQCLLIATTRGGEAMHEVLERRLLCQGVQDLIETSSARELRRPSDRRGGTSDGGDVGGG